MGKAAIVWWSVLHVSGRVAEMATCHWAGHPALAPTAKCSYNEVQQILVFRFEFLGPDVSNGLRKVAQSSPLAFPGHSESPRSFRNIRHSNEQRDSFMEQA